MEKQASADTNKSNVKNDVLAKVLKHFADEIPLTEVINAYIVQGCWWNNNPSTKDFHIKNLKNISGLLNLDKIAEKKNIKKWNY